MSAVSLITVAGAHALKRQQRSCITVRTHVHRQQTDTTYRQADRQTVHAAHTGVVSPIASRTRNTCQVMVWVDMADRMTEFLKSQMWLTEFPKRQRPIIPKIETNCRACIWEGLPVRHYRVRPVGFDSTLFVAIDNGPASFFPLGIVEFGLALVDIEEQDCLPVQSADQALYFRPILRALVWCMQAHRETERDRESEWVGERFPSPGHKNPAIEVVGRKTGHTDHTHTHTHTYTYISYFM